MQDFFTELSQFPLLTPLSQKRGKKSRGGMWENLPKVKEAYAISITEGKATIYANDDAGILLRVSCIFVANGASPSNL